MPNGQRHQDKPGDESDEYEEVEVTDDEDDDQYVAKRQKVEDMASEQPIEFDEDDIAYQLTVMGQDYGLDPGEYGNIENDQLEEGAEGLPLSEEDANALFKDMLEDHRVNPYHPWDRLIEEVRIIEDDRYTLLPNMKTRRDVWDEWSRGRMQELKELREKEEKKDPLIPYLAFLQAKATPKLYWAEFRRKFMREPEMRNSKLSDKEREKWYREYNNRRFNFSAYRAYRALTYCNRLEITREHLEVRSCFAAEVNTTPRPESIHVHGSPTPFYAHQYPLHCTQAFGSGPIH